MPKNKKRRDGSTMTAVSVRGQTIIPKHLREVYHIREGDLIRWRPQKDGLFVERVVVRPARGEEFPSEAEWQALDRLVARQRKQQRLTRYTSLEQAKEHSRKLARYGR